MPRHAATLRLAAVFVAFACNSDGASGPDTETVDAHPTAVGTLTGVASTASIGSQGGSLTSPDARLTLTVPAGAVTAATGFSIQAVTNNAAGGIGTGYRLLPAGTSFAQPVELSFTYGEADIAGGLAQTLAVAYQTADGYWEIPESESVDESGHVVTVSTTHFSDWSLLQEVQLQPSAPSVRVGTSQSFSLIACRREEVTNERGARRYICREGETQQFAVNRWLVNGISGGSGSLGTIGSAGLGAATYRAPATVPSPSSVQVGAELRGSGGAQALVFATVELYDDEFVVRGRWTATATHSFSQNADGIDQTTTTTARATLVGLADVLMVSESGTVTYQSTLVNTQSVGRTCTETVTASGAIQPYAAPAVINGSMAFFPIEGDNDRMIYYTSLPFAAQVTGQELVQCTGLPDFTQAVNFGVVWLTIPSQFSQPPGFIAPRTLANMSGTATIVNGPATDVYEWSLARSGTR